MTKITGFDTFDVRFPTSRTLAGSDAMNSAPDYSAAYVVIRTDAPDPALSGHGFAFTIGRGNDVQLAAIRLLEPFLAGQDLDEVLADLGGLGRRLVSDSPLHWLGPSCGVMHMATGAVLNACWDLAARRAGKPLWLLLAEMSPQEITGLVDFRYLSDALTPDEALALLERGAAGRAARIAALRRDGYPAYSTGPGWLGYSDERLAELCAEAVAEGFTQVKIKVGAALEDDKRRCAIAREVVGDDIGIAIDANQVWDVPTAIAWISELAPFQPAWVEEPTAPEDILGTAAIRRACPAGPGGHRRACRQPGHVQAAAAGRRHGHHADRRVPGGRGEREHRQPAAGGQVRRAGLPARRRGRPLRDRPAPVDVRLRGAVRHGPGAPDRVDRPPARALRRARHGRARPLPRAGAPGASTEILPGRWRNTPTRRARPGATAGCRDRAAPAGRRSPRRPRAVG